MKTADDDEGLVFYSRIMTFLGIWAMVILLVWYGYNIYHGDTLLAFHRNGIMIPNWLLWASWGYILGWTIVFIPCEGYCIIKEDQGWRRYLNEAFHELGLWWVAIIALLVVIYYFAKKQLGLSGSESGIQN